MLISPFHLLTLLSLSLVFSSIFVKSDLDDGFDEKIELDEEEPIVAENIEKQAQASVNISKATSYQNIVSLPFARISILFVQPNNTNLPAGQLATILVSLRNDASSALFIEGIDGSLRFPQEFSFYVQNFSNIEYNKLVRSGYESTFEFTFTPSDTFAQRQYILVLSLRLKDMQFISYVNSVFNETISVVDANESFDIEMFFLFLMLIAIVVLGALGSRHLITVFKKKGKIPRFGGLTLKISSSPAVDSTPKGVDMAWIPKEHLQNNSPKTSLQQRSARILTPGASLSHERYFSRF